MLPRGLVRFLCTAVIVTRIHCYVRLTQWTASLVTETKPGLGHPCHLGAQRQVPHRRVLEVRVSAVHFTGRWGSLALWLLPISVSQARVCEGLN